VVQQDAAAIQKSAAASDRLRRDAADLAHTVSQFHLAADPEAPAADPGAPPADSGGFGRPETPLRIPARRGRALLPR